jgi:hypothetical protein
MKWKENGKAFDLRSKAFLFCCADCASVRGGWFRGPDLVSGLVIFVVESPVSNRVPIVSQGLCGMHGAAGPVAAGHRVGGAIAVAAPAYAFGVLRVQGKLLGHAKCLLTEGAAMAAPIFPDMCPAYCRARAKFLDLAQAQSLRPDARRMARRAAVRGNWGGESAAR